MSSNSKGRRTQMNVLRTKQVSHGEIETTTVSRSQVATARRPVCYSYPCTKTPSTENNLLRPISLLPVLGKILESFMVDWLCDFLAPTLDSNQFGGLKQRSTRPHALVCILHSWCSTLDQGGSVRALFVDFTKAFDRVDHNIGLLLTKLKDRGIPHCLVKWFHSYTYVFGVRLYA